MKKMNKGTVLAFELLSPPSLVVLNVSFLYTALSKREKHCEPKISIDNLQRQKYDKVKLLRCN